MAAKLEGGASTRVPDPARARVMALPGAADRRSTADTIPPMPLKDLLSAGGANLYVLSTDAELIDTVKRAGGEHYPVFAVAEWIELELAIDTQRCGIALLDSDLLGDTLPSRVAALERYSHRLVVLVAADRAAGQAMMSLLSDRKIHRLLIKPPALGITRLLVESAVNRCLQLRELAKATGDSDPLLESLTPKPRGRAPASVLLMAGGALLIGVFAIVGLSSWWRSEGPDTSATPATEVAVATPAPAPLVAIATPAEVPAASPAPAAQPRFADLLARAEEAFGAGRLAAPTGDNALDYYLVILAAEPAEPVARVELSRVIDVLFAQAEEALLADEHAAAAAALNHVRRADPTSSRLAFLDEQLQRARTAAARPPPAPVAAAARPPIVIAPRPAAATASPPAAAPTGEVATELLAAARLKLESGDLDAAAVLVGEAKRLGAESEAVARLEAAIAAARVARVARRNTETLALAESRLGTGALVTPERDSALDYLERLQREAPTFAGVDRAWDRWRTAVVAEINRALAARDWAAAETTLAALQRAPQGDRVSAPLRADLEYGRLQEQYLATAAPANELTLVERKAVVYPPDALARGTEGWVEIEFVVDTAGRTRDLTVVAAEPKGRFDEAALAALREYRYRPFERDGRVFERRVRLRTRFELQ